MNLAPLLESSFAIKLHVATVVPAALIGPVIFLNRKGTRFHRMLGRVWVFLMVLTAASTFFIHQINTFMGFSPIHFLSAFVLAMCWLAIRDARAHNIAAHKMKMIMMYIGGIVIAGGFTFIPGRIMHEVVFTSPTGPFDAASLALLVSMMAGFTLAFFMAARFSMPRRA